MKKEQAELFLRKPEWLRRGIPRVEGHHRLRSFLDGEGLHTVCREARCPNAEECFAGGTATFLILGNTCTRRCRFCAVNQGKPERPDPGEPGRVARAALRLSLDYVVVTSVTRDDLPDGGAGAFAETIRTLKAAKPAIRVEVLIPDFQGDDAALGTVLAAGPDVLNHNLETVERLYPPVRPGALYARSLELLRRAGGLMTEIPVKSGMMLGLGERREEIESALQDLLATGCRILTLGQYLQPRKECLPTARFVAPKEFEAWRRIALSMGFDQVAAGPLVRSSYQAETLLGPRSENGTS